MIETNVDILTLTKPGAKLTGDEKKAFKILENLEEKRSEQALNARIADNTKRMAEYRSQYRRDRQQRLFKAIDVAMWSALLVGLLILGVMII